MSRLSRCLYPELWFIEACGWWLQHDICVGFALQNVLRFLLVNVTGVIVLAIPNFATLMGLIGATCCTMIAFTLPGLFHLKICGSNLTRMQKLFDVFLIFLGFIGWVTINSLRVSHTVCRWHDVQLCDSLDLRCIQIVMMYCICCSAGIGTLDALQRVQHEHTQSDDVDVNVALTHSVLSNSSRLVDTITSNLTHSITTTPTVHFNGILQKILDDSLNSTRRWQMFHNEHFFSTALA